MQPLPGCEADLTQSPHRFHTPNNGPGTFATEVPKGIFQLGEKFLGGASYNHQGVLLDLRPSRRISVGAMSQEAIWPRSAYEFNNTASVLCCEGAVERPCVSYEI